MLSRKAMRIGITIAATGYLLGCSVVLADGPDVIVGELSDVTSYGTDAPTGIFAYAVGTTSCNRGTDPLNWLTGGSENRHPVIGQNLYKLDNGRIVQLGQSWLKHGFTALQGNTCGLGCSAYPNGTALGIGCSDPYSSGLNGSQGGLGPKSEVNAATGVFPYPPRRMPAFNGNTPKRLQAKLIELPGTASALYFVEGQYIAQDDAGARNSWNNASYRRVTIAQTAPYTMALQGITEREKPAIMAWREHGGGVGVTDSNVILAPLDIPSDGRMILAWKITQTGPALWHYEYAIENLTSDRSGQSFRVPFPAGATITNAGFHDVDAHSGERWDNSVDWTLTIGSDSITWNGPTYSGTPGAWNSTTATWTEPTGNDSTANALRWGTLYNFWFDADVAPTSARGAVEMGLFRPGAAGTPNQVTWSAATPGSTRIGGQPNDACAAARPIMAGLYAFSIGNANSGGPAACLENGSDQVGSDVWFSYASTCAGTATLSTCGSDFDTRIAVYSGSNCPADSSTQVACNDNSAICGAGSTSSQTTFTTTNGQNFLIRVGGTTDATGNGVLSLVACPTTGACCAASGSCTLRTQAGCSSGSFLGIGQSCVPNICPAPTRPTNDDCANATPIGDSAIGQPTIVGNIVAATVDGTSSCAAAATTPSVWYAYTPAVTGSVTVDMCTADYDTALAIFTGSCTSAAEIACDDDACGSLHSRISVPMTAGTRYLLRASGYNQNLGSFTMRVTGGQGVVSLGACCNGAACTLTTATNCSAANFRGVGAICGTAGNPTSCCRANFNGQGGVTVQDIFDFIGVYFAGDMAADFNQSGGVSIEDIFTFIGAWFAGCP